MAKVEDGRSSAAGDMNCHSLSKENQEKPSTSELFCSTLNYLFFNGGSAYVHPSHPLSLYQSTSSPAKSGMKISSQGRKNKKPISKQVFLRSNQSHTELFLAKSSSKTSSLPKKCKQTMWTCNFAKQKMNDLKQIWI